MTLADFKSLKDSRILRGVVLYAYIPLSVMYMELLLRILCGYRVVPGLHFALLVSCTAGLIISAVALLFSRQKVCRCVACIMTGLVCVVFTLEYFMYSTYKVFMSFDTIFISESRYTI